MADTSLGPDEDSEAPSPLLAMLDDGRRTLAALAALFIIHAFRIYVFTWIALSCWLSWRLLEGLLPERQRRGLLFFFLAAIALLPADHFGQREHYLMATVLPYLVLVARRKSEIGSE